MKITILTMFPEMLESLQNSPIYQHACDSEKCSLEIIDIRMFAKGSYRHIDDSPYGGGAGMILRYDVLHNALQSVRKVNSYVVLPIPAGIPYHQKTAHMFASKEHLILIAGHYEGVDARIYDECDALISMGDYILSAGEYACMAVADSVMRLLDGVIKKESTENESFESAILEYPQYTKPATYNGKCVPEILRSGNHQAIREYNIQQALLWTKKYRPDLCEKESSQSK